MNKEFFKQNKNKLRALITIGATVAVPIVMLL